MTTTPRRILAAAAIALGLGLGLTAPLAGFSASYPVRLLQQLSLFALAAVALVGGAAWLALRMAGWREPTSEAEFEAVVRRSETLAAAARERPDVELAGDDELADVDPAVPAHAESWPEPHGPWRPGAFEALVREALDELPDELRDALAGVAVVIADDGWRRRAYGLYHGDGVARDDVADRIVIYRDTLLRDFGLDAAALRAQVQRTVRHELAHHLGWDEPGVRGLGL